MNRAYYSTTIEDFLETSPEKILGKLAISNTFSLEQLQRDAWLEEINILCKSLFHFRGMIYFEFSIPRMGQRIDVLLLIGSVIFVLEFKVGEKIFTSYALDQVWDYALDLKNFHESSHGQLIAPILIATKAASINEYVISATQHNDKLLFPIKCNSSMLGEVIESVLSFCEGKNIDPLTWENGRYSPTPTIVEAAMALYNGHSVKEISRNDASAINLDITTNVISNIIRQSREASQKSICFVTGVPGAGKTLVGLNIATTHIDKTNDLYSVFLSGNGPLVAVLREALTRDKVRIDKENGKKTKKSEVMANVKMFIQNIHHFRDECLLDQTKAPIEHVALFDEAQRAWDYMQTSSFMRRKKKNSNFDKSEPEFLISCLDRHADWAVIVCLVGGGQEINTGEAGISEWINSLIRSFPEWHVYISSRLTDSEYSAGDAVNKLMLRPNGVYNDALHLAVSMRSFRAENVSLLVKQMLDLDIEGARSSLDKIREKFPIVITRDLSNAKRWLKNQARGTERYGIVVSSQAERLKPHAIDIRTPVDPIHWFLDTKEDVRSSYYLEDVATEFQIQGLELDWVCCTWDADLRYVKDKWEYWSFRGNRWMHVKKNDRQRYLKNAYRVLLTRARHGMVIVVPHGDMEDPTRCPEYYDPIYEYLVKIGFEGV
ncbi:MAG: DUF2075 domain-containing protein [Deltaproteobacteria bacterium]